MTNRIEMLKREEEAAYDAACCHEDPAMWGVWEDAKERLEEALKEEAEKGE